MRETNVEASSKPQKPIHVRLIEFINYFVLNLSQKQTILLAVVELRLDKKKSIILRDADFSPVASTRRMDLSYT